MTDREKLIELIVDIENKLISAYPYTTDEYRIRETADHLIANGVTVQKYGQWEIIGMRPVGTRNTHYCSLCGCHGTDGMRFCPGCGAYMWGDVNDE